MKGTLICFVIVVMGTMPFGAISDCGDSSNRNLHISITQVHERLVNLSWPKEPAGARIEGYAVFQISVSTQGNVSCVNPIGGHPLLLSHLSPAIHVWTFRSGMPFLGLVAVRYGSSEGFQLL